MEESLCVFILILEDCSSEDCSSELAKELFRLWSLKYPIVNLPRKIALFLVGKFDIKFSLKQIKRLSSEDASVLSNELLISFVEIGLGEEFLDRENNDDDKILHREYFLEELVCQLVQGINVPQEIADYLISKDLLKDWRRVSHLMPCNIVFVLYCISNGCSLMYIPDEFRSNKDVIHAAIAKRGFSELAYISEGCKLDYSLALEMILKDRRNCRYFNPLRTDKEFLDYTLSEIDKCMPCEGNESYRNYNKGLFVLWYSKRPEICQDTGLLMYAFACLYRDDILDDHSSTHRKRESEPLYPGENNTLLFPAILKTVLDYPYLLEVNHHLDLINKLSSEHLERLDLPTSNTSLIKLIQTKDQLRWLMELLIANPSIIEFVTKGQIFGMFLETGLLKLCGNPSFEGHPLNKPLFEKFNEFIKNGPHVLASLKQEEFVELSQEYVNCLKQYFKELSEKPNGPEWLNINKNRGFLKYI